MSELTRILSRIESGDPQAAQQLLPLVYDELRKLAAARLAHEQPGQTLQATALVHEAYIRLVDIKENRGRSTEDGDDQLDKPPVPRPPSSVPRFDNRGHFFAAAAEAMRRILVERARQKESAKRGGNRDRVALNDLDLAVLPLAGHDLLALDAALQKLEQKHPRKAQLTKLRFFAGLSMAEAAHALGVSLSTAEKEWAYARSWLRLEIEGKGD